MKPRILIVDDEEDFLDILSDFLEEEGYRVYTSRSGTEALSRLESTPVDLIVSDINMPGMKGFELLDRVAAQYPNIKRILITAYDVNDYIDLAVRYQVGNIITKTIPFNFDETGVLIRTVLSEAVFGLSRYVDGPVSRMTIRHTREIEPAIEHVLDAMSNPVWKRKFRHGLAEVVINAVFYGSRTEQGDKKQQWILDTPLPPNREIEISWSVSADVGGVAVMDRRGMLTKRDVLYWLERNTVRDGNGSSRGFFDTHGKGLFITRETNDRFIINTRRVERTEVIMLNYAEGMYRGHRPLWIYEF